MKHWLRVLLAVALSVAAVAGSRSFASAAPRTYSATETIPVPPASSYQGGGGGDGWAVALTQDAVYNVFHHSSSLRVACHWQTDATPCWSPKTITDASGGSFATSNHPGLWMDQASERLYVFATQSATGVGGVVCVDTSHEGSNPYCGFTPLSLLLSSSASALGSPVLIGSRWYAFNYVPGRAMNDGSANSLLCFDIDLLEPCTSQPYPVTVPLPGTVSTGSVSPVPAAIGDRIIIPMRVGSIDLLACYSANGDGTCDGSWPRPITSRYVGNNGAPFPLLDASGSTIGVCLPTSGVPCFDLSGTAVDSPPNISEVVTPSSPYSGPAVVIGPRVYVPNGNRDLVHCYNFHAKTGCTNFPRSFNNLGYLYTVNDDPRRPTCIWVNADNGSGQIQNFDAYTGGTCGEGPIRVLASRLVVNSPECEPSSYTSLKVLQPARSSYRAGTVSFADGDGDVIPGVAEVALDGSGTADLRGLPSDTTAGLPQFLITLSDPQDTPGEVTVELTWTGEDSPRCVPGLGTGKTKHYVALGDSFSSGEGAAVPPVTKSSDGNFFSGTDTSDNRCHRSRNSYPALLQGKDSPPVFEFHACSGALLSQMTNQLGRDRTQTHDKYSGQWEEPAQLDHIALATGLPNQNVDLVTLSIGGNDAGFVEALEECIKGWGNTSFNGCNHGKLQSRMNKAIERFKRSGRELVYSDGTWENCPNCALGTVKFGPHERRDRYVVDVPSLNDLYREIARRAPNARIRVMGYPAMFPANATSRCVVGSYQKWPRQTISYTIEAKDMTFFAHLANQLNDTIRNQVQIARSAGVNIEFVDVRSAFAGHEVCTKDPWLNGLLREGFGVSPFSFHPNAKGHQQYLAALEASLG